MSTTIGGLTPANSPSYIQSTDLIPVQRSGYTYSAYVNIGNGANQILQLDSLGDIPAVFSGNTTVLDPTTSSVSPLNTVLANINFQSYVAPFTGSQARTLNSKLSDWVSVLDFGAVGDGITDDTAALVAALAASKNVMVPAGKILAITSLVDMPAESCLQFLGGTGDTSGSTNYPASYILSKITSGSYVLRMNNGCRIIAGGVIQTSPGVASEGIRVIGRRCYLDGVYVKGAVTYGFNISDGATGTELRECIAYGNGSHGFYISGNLSGSNNFVSNVNLLSCSASSNTGNGIHVQSAYYTELLGCASLSNTGNGLYLDGANNSGTSLPYCRFTSVHGGNYQSIYDTSAYASYYMSDSSQIPTTAAIAGTGSAIRTWIGCTGSQIPSITPYTYTSDTVTSNSGRPLIVNGYTANTTGNGTGISFGLQRTVGGAYHDAGYITTYQGSTTKDNLAFTLNNNGVMSLMMTLDLVNNAVSPGANSTYSLGTPSLYWSNLYATAASITTLTATTGNITTVNSTTTNATTVAATGSVTTPSLTINSGTPITQYVKGTWTPVDASGAGLSFAGVVGDYVLNGSVCTVWANLQYPATANGSNAIIGGLPFTILNDNSQKIGFWINTTASTTVFRGFSNPNTTNFNIVTGALSNVINSTLTTANLFFMFSYRIN